MDHILHSPHFDYQLCRKLPKLGCLDDHSKEDEAYRFLEYYEEHTEGEGEPEPDAIVSRIGPGELEVN
jgi:hypothetical protein